MRCLIWMAALALAASAQAQIRLPSLPPVTLPGAPLGALDPLAPASNALQAYADARRQAISRLIRSNRRLIEADPHGDPILRGEILAVGGDERAARWSAAGFVVVQTHPIDAAERLAVLKVPANLSTEKALRELRAADPGGIYDYDHLYLGGGNLEQGKDSDTAPPSPPEGAPPSRPKMPPRARIGLIDAGVDATHPAFRGSEIRSWGCEGKPVPSAHGTAVASLLVTRGPAEIDAADVYCGQASGGSVDLIAAALDWMADEKVAVINVSLVGPRNLILERVVDALIARGHLLVAAVGNDGPAAPPLYPAAYPGVIGVTAVDGHRRVLIEAERGPQVMFAAQGADLEAAGIDHREVAVRGTSFASPTVARLLALEVAAPDAPAARAAVEALARQAIDLGPPGRDLTYGFGLVGSESP